MAENVLGSSFGSSTLHVEPRQVTAKDPLNVRTLAGPLMPGSYVYENNVRTVFRQPEGNKHKKLSKTKGKRAIVVEARLHWRRLLDSDFLLQEK